MNARKVITLERGLHHRLRVRAVNNGTLLQQETDTAIKAHLNASRAALKAGVKLPRPRK